MELATLLLVLSLITVSIYFHVQKTNSRRRKAGGKFPPGPYPFPIIGNIHQLGKSPHRTIAKLCKTYGPIMSLKLGTRSMVIVSSPELAKEVLLKHDQICSGRAIPVAAQAQDLYKQSMGFLPVTSNEWKKLRKIYKEQLFSTHRLDASQGLRREKVKQLCDHLEECCVSGRAVNIEEAAFTTTLNLMSSTLFSVDFGNYDDPNSSTQKLKEAVQGVVNSVSSPNLADYFPILRIIDPQGLKKRAEFCFGKLLAIFEDLINQRLESRQNGSPKKSDLLETLLDQREQYDISLREIKYILFPSSLPITSLRSRNLISPDRVKGKEGMGGPGTTTGKGS
ncbi:hypothetical protein BUALT_Bualt10G0094700 [Buddleja alternifolia]|uniref:Cytochrome P450 n=1 Tax=Buddleja alternifolia TaxID=168488 RepID=A0AAV6WWJ9_9LAMI|nr:hypothetical protein BUALT_Bualt10G0094700 [Buddleja alternifolia]